MSVPGKSVAARWPTEPGLTDMETAGIPQHGEAVVAAKATANRWLR